MLSNVIMLYYKPFLSVSRIGFVFSLSWVLFLLSTEKSDIASGEMMRTRNGTQETGIVLPPPQSGTTGMGGEGCPFLANKAKREGA